MVPANDLTPVFCISSYESAVGDCSSFVSSASTPADSHKSSKRCRDAVTKSAAGALAVVMLSVLPFDQSLRFHNASEQLPLKAALPKSLYERLRAGILSERVK